MVVRESFLTVGAQVAAAPGPAHYTPGAEREHMHVKGGNSLKSKVHVHVPVHASLVSQRCEICSQLSCLGSSVGRALCLEYRVSWVRVPPEAAHFSRKSDCLGCAVLLFLACLFDLACFFLSSFSSLI